MPETPFDPFSLADHANAESALAAARAAGGASTPYAGVHVVTLDSDVREVMADTELFSNQYNFALERGPAPAGDDPFKVITRSDPPFHTTLRDFMRTWFAPAELRKLGPRIRQIVADAVGELPSTGQADLVHTLARVIPTRTVYAFIGIPESDWEQLQALADENNTKLPDLDEEIIGRIFGTLAGIIERRRISGERHEDVIDGLLYGRDGVEFAPEAAPAHLFQLLVAGTDTTTGLIGNVLYRLLEDPSRWDRLVKEPSLIAPAIEESLRRDAPLQYTMRTATAATSLGGCPVAPRDRVVISLQSADTDEATWGETALDFDIDRQGAGTHIAFARGIHTCLGAPLARIETQATLEALTTRFPHMRLVDGYELEYLPALQFRMPSALPVELAPVVAAPSAEKNGHGEHL
ncbi:cytochrome P450 [Streptomyces sp. NPDC101455]|uniref:cytochrome P450 n=1 Tax=Streptomyces sp. NPDC101455 TaxID=3366142 RepID=UPI0037F82AA1